MSFSSLQHYRISASLLYFNQGLVFSSWASRIPDIKNSLGLNEAQLGSILFALPVGQLLTMALSGYLVSRYGSKNTISVAAIFYPLALLCLGLSTAAWQLVLSLIFFGISANMCNIAINTQGVGVERLYRHSIMSSFHGLWSLAGVFGGLFGAWMVSLYITPFHHFCVIVILVWSIFFLIRKSLLPRDNNSVESGKKNDPYRPKPIFTRPDRYILILGIIAFSSMICEGTMFDWSGIYFEQVIRSDKQWTRLGYIAFMTAMTCGRFIADKLVTRFGVIPVVRSGGVLITTGLGISVLFPNLFATTIGFLLVGFGTSSIVPLCYSMAGKSKTMLPGVALATVSTIGFLGFLLGPPLIGYIAQASNLQWSLTVVALTGLVTIAASSGLRKYR